MRLRNWHNSPTDLKLDNILVSFEDDSVLEKFVQTQPKTSMLQRRREGYSTYQSLNQFGPPQVRLGPLVPLIADFSHAYWIDDFQPQINPIQPDNYRAPEVILGTGWGTAADIWNLGTLVCGIADLLHFNQGICWPDILGSFGTC